MISSSPGLNVDKLSGDISILLKSPWNFTRYDPVLPVKYPSDRSAGGVHDE